MLVPPEDDQMSFIKGPHAMQKAPTCKNSPPYPRTPHPGSNGALFPKPCSPRGDYPAKDRRTAPQNGGGPGQPGKTRRNNLLWADFPHKFPNRRCSIDLPV